MEKQLREVTEGAPYKRPLLLNFLHLYEVYFFLCLVLSFVPLIVADRGNSGITVPDSFPWLFMLLSLVSVPVYLIDVYIRRLWLFALSLLSFGLLLLLPGNSAVKVLYGAVAAWSVLTLLMRRFRPDSIGQTENVSAFIGAMAILIILYILAGTLPRPAFQKLVLISAIFFTLLFFFGLHESRVDFNLYLQNKEVMNQPLAKTRSLNRSFYRIFMAVLAVLLVGAVLVPLDSLTGLQNVKDAILRVILTVFTWLVSLIRFKKDGKQAGFSEKTAEGETAEEVIAGTAGEASSFWEVLEVITLVLLALAAVALVIYLGFRIYKAFYGRTRRKLEWTSDGEEEVEEEEEKIERETVRRTSVFLRPARTEAEKIRRRYYQKVAASIDKKVLRSDTPKESSCKINDKELTDLLPRYEQVRYSGKEI